MPRRERLWIASEKVKGHGDWDAPEYTDTAGSKEKKVTKALSFYKMETDEVSERYITPCFVNGLDAYDGEINLAFDENLISNEFMVKLCLDYKVKKRNKVLKKELIVALRGELYFVKFIINPKEDDVEPGVIVGRSFMRLVNGIVDFGRGDHTVYPEQDPFKDDSEKTKKSMDDSTKEATKEALALRISQRFVLLEEVRLVLETMAYNDKYKKVLDDIWKDKVELDAMIEEEEEKAINKVKSETLKEKDDPEAFIFPIRFEGQVNENALADTGSDTNIMPYRIYEKLGREEIKKVDRGITMINHTQAEAIGILTNVLYLDTTTLRELIESEGRLIPKDPQPGVPRVAIPRPPRASMHDFYERMGSMKIRQGGAYNPLGYAQPQAKNDEKDQKCQRNPLKALMVVVQIVLWYLDSGCSKHMTRNHSQLINFVSKFLGTFIFENDHIANTMGYRDYQIGNVTISRVYYVEGLRHNLFSVGQFCDSDLEVAFCKHTCFIYDLEGVDLLKGSRGLNLYTFSLDNFLLSSQICLLSKASKTKSWLWHQRLSHLNFDYITSLAKQGLLRGLPKLKYQKDHLCFACALSKSKKHSHKPKAEVFIQEKLYLLHMDLYGPMRIQSINGRKYILVIVDDYSRFTWVKFLRSKDEVPEFVIKFLKMIQVLLNATVHNIRTDNGTEFVNQTLKAYYEVVGISNQTSVARTPQ
ncbi:retrovirus-related pol polyprotein from transposon TNT 1-94 [Tanacetum coccineum]